MTLPGSCIGRGGRRGPGGGGKGGCTSPRWLSAVLTIIIMRTTGLLDLNPHALALGLGRRLVAPAGAECCLLPSASPTPRPLPIGPCPRPMPNAPPLTRGPLFLFAPAHRSCQAPHPHPTSSLDQTCGAPALRKRPPALAAHVRHIWGGWHHLGHGHRAHVHFAGRKCDLNAAPSGPRKPHQRRSRRPDLMADLGAVTGQSGAPAQSSAQKEAVH